MSNEHTDRIEAARVHAEGLVASRGIRGKIVSNRHGVTIEVDHPASDRHGENAISWDELDKADDNVLIEMIDDLVANVA